MGYYCYEGCLSNYVLSINDNSAVSSPIQNVAQSSSSSDFLLLSDAYVNGWI